MAGENGWYLSGRELQHSTSSVTLERFHTLYRAIGTDEYRQFFGQVALGKNYDPSQPFRPLWDAYGAAYRAFDVSYRDSSPVYRWLNWEFNGTFDAERERAIRLYVAALQTSSGSSR